jgi:hypothetical protein
VGIARFTSVAIAFAAASLYIGGCPWTGHFLNFFGRFRAGWRFEE